MIETHFQGTRLHYRLHARDAFEKLLEFQNTIANCGVEKLLLELIKIRVSQINGCAFCLDMHIKDSLALGESQERINMLIVWRETNLYSEREQAALAWAEAVTNIQTTHISDELYKLMTKNFDEKEISYIDMAVVAINSWNRLAIPFRIESGKYKSTLTSIKTNI